MTVTGFALLLLAAICMAVANLMMKIGIARTGVFALSASGLLQLARQPVFVAGFLLTPVAALMWFRILSTQRLSTAYPLFVSLTYCLITTAAFYFLHERISTQKMIGLLVIIAGIVMVSLGDRT